MASVPSAPPPLSPPRTIILALVVLANTAILIRYMGQSWPFAPVGNDFADFWVSARLAVEGHAAQAYDPDVLTRTLRALLPAMPVGDYSLAYPPPFLLLLAPLGLLSLSGAYLAWIAVSLAAFAAVLARVVGPRLAVAAAFLSPGFALNLWFGQNGLLFGALIGLALAAETPLVAGVMLGLLTLKPHFAVALGAVFLLAGRWRALAVAAVVAAVVAAASLAVFGSGTWGQYVAGLHRAADLSSPVLQGVSVRGSVYWTALSWGAPAAVAAVAQAMTALTAALVAARSWRRRDPAALRLAAAAAALPLILPRLGTYDLAFLAVAAVALANSALGRLARGQLARGGAAWLGLALAFWMAPQLVQMLAVYGVQVLAPVSGLLLAASLRLAGAPAATPAPSIPG